MVVKAEHVNQGELPRELVVEYALRATALTLGERVTALERRERT